MLHSDNMVTGQDCVVTVVNCRQNSDYAAIGSSVTALLAVVNGDLSLSSHHVVTVPSR